MSSRQATWKLALPRRSKEPDGSTAPAQARVPRVARLIALAIKLDEQVRHGVFRDYAEIARLGHVSRARLTQIMNLLNLAPDIIEDVVLLSADAAPFVVTERMMRQMGKHVCWYQQREIWSRLKAKPGK